MGYRHVRTLVAALATILSALVAGVSAGEAASKSFRLPSAMNLSVPSHWIIANESQLRAYERHRDEALKQHGVSPAASGELASVPFQARAGSASGSLTVMVTLLPSESSQEEITGWPLSTIQKLGAALGEAQAKSMKAVGVTDIVVGPAALVDAGGKKAVYFTLSFTGPDGQRYSGEKYFIYTATRTVVYSTQVSAHRLESSAHEREAILATLLVE